VTNNDVLRRVRYALDLGDDSMVELFALGGIEAPVEQVWGWLGREDEPGTIECPDDVLITFLDALIVKRRGPPPSGAKPPQVDTLTNNAILKKLRIALAMRDTDVLEVIHLGGQSLSKAELGGLSRTRGHKHYRPCGNQLLRAFLSGLTTKLRG
jgi:uncharacterized protein YehS (DUF1456 family)